MPFRHLLVFCSVLAASPALASLEYPGEIRDVLTACRAPSCTVCHSSTRGGVGTATRPFAITMQNAGLTGSRNFASLHTALAQVERDGSDSDGDGVLDIPELKQGSDPSNASSTTADCQAPTGGGGRPGSGSGGATDPGVLDPPSYGCGAAPSALGGVAWLVAGLSLATLRRRRAGGLIRNVARARLIPCKDGTQ